MIKSPTGCRQNHDDSRPTDAAKKQTDKAELR